VGGGAEGDEEVVSPLSREGGIEGLEAYLNVKFISQA
jgi:hypothetical protein